MRNKKMGYNIWRNDVLAFPPCLTWRNRTSKRYPAEQNIPEAFFRRWETKNWDTIWRNEVLAFLPWLTWRNRTSKKDPAEQNIPEVKHWEQPRHDWLIILPACLFASFVTTPSVPCVSIRKNDLRNTSHFGTSWKSHKKQFWTSLLVHVVCF
jgi:hypothetical protein